MLKKNLIPQRGEKPFMVFPLKNNCTAGGSVFDMLPDGTYPVRKNDEG